MLLSFFVFNQILVVSFALKTTFGENSFIMRRPFRLGEVSRQSLGILDYDENFTPILFDENVEMGQINPPKFEGTRIIRRRESELLANSEPSLELRPIEASRPFKLYSSTSRKSDDGLNLNQGNQYGMNLSAEHDVIAARMLTLSFIVGAVIFIANNVIDKKPPAPEL